MYFLCPHHGLHAAAVSHSLSKETAENAQQHTPCDAWSTRAKNSNQALSFILVLKIRWLTWSKPTGTDQVNAWGQSENRASKDQRKNRSEKEKKNLIPLQSCSQYLPFFSMTSWAEAPKQHSHPNHLPWLHQPRKVYFQIQTGQYQNRCYIWFTNFVTIISRAISFLEWEKKTSL